MNILPFQETGAEWLAERKRALLADEMGLGKTIQAIRACDYVFARKVIILCPASVVPAWQGAIAAWRIGEWTAEVLGYERAVDERDRITNQQWDVAIFDEAHYLKNPDTLRTQVAYGDLRAILPAYKGLAEQSEYAWAITGTPQMNYPNEWYTHFRALAPDRILGPRSGRVWTYEQFQAHFCDMRPGFNSMKIVDGKNEPQLLEKLDGFMLRRIKRDVLPELPDVRFSEFPVAPDFTDDVFGRPDEIEIVKKAFAEHGLAGLKSVSEHVSVLRRLTGLAKVKAVADYIWEWRQGHPDRKLVVFAQHTEIIDALWRHPRVKDTFVMLIGKSSQHQRERSVRLFQTDPAITGFIGQIQAAGTGITLTAASDLLFIESSWVPAENAQAAMRIHRIGQKALCNVRYAILPNSIDAMVARAVMRKSESIAKALGEAA